VARNSAVSTAILREREQNASFVPRVHEIVGRERIYSPEPLNDSDGVPVDVVIDKVVAVLQILTFSDAIRCDQQVQFPLAGQVVGAFLGTCRESGQDAGKIAAEAREVGLIPSCSHNERGMKAQSLECPWCELLIEVLGRVGEGREHNDLAVAGVKRNSCLAFDQVAKCVELCVSGRSDLHGRRVERGETLTVLDELLAPTDNVDVLK
jgi:hypothetical protein